MSFVAKPPSGGKEASSPLQVSGSAALPTSNNIVGSNSGALPTAVAALPSFVLPPSQQQPHQPVAPSPQQYYSNLQQQAASLYVQQVAAGAVSAQGWAKESFQSIAQRFGVNDQQQVPITPTVSQPSPSITISKVPTSQNHHALAPKPENTPIVQTLQATVGSNSSNNVASHHQATLPKLAPKPIETPPTPKKDPLPPVPVSHQKQLTIVQKTPTKSTLRLATVTPRIKTTPKKSPPPPPPLVSKSPVPTDRPNALIKQKDLSPPLSTSPSSPASAVPLKALPNPIVKETPSPKETKKQEVVKDPPTAAQKTPPPPQTPAPKPVSQNAKAEKTPEEKPPKVSEKETKVDVKPQKETKEPKPRPPKTPKATSSDDSEQRIKRARKEVQPFQSPIPEIENVKKLSIATSTVVRRKSFEDKLIIFYK